MYVRLPRAGCGVVPALAAASALTTALAVYLTPAQEVAAPHDARALAVVHATGVGMMTVPLRHVESGHLASVRKRSSRTE